MRKRLPTSCSAFLLRGSQLSRANSSADAELLSIDVLPYQR
jgi:hypothetical protein